MNARDITIETFTKNSVFKTGIIFLILFAIDYAIAIVFVGLGFITGGFANENPIFIIPLGLLAGLGMVFWICGLVFIFSGLKGKKVYNNYIQTYGEDNLMSEIYNDTLFILSRKNKPITIITSKHIFEVGRNIFETPRIDFAYGHRYKNATNIHAYTIDGDINVFANGIALKSNEQTQLFQALQRVNPYIILGYTSENLKEHNKRVKEYKQNK